MNRIVLYVFAVIFALVILVFMCTYQVRFNEQAIVTTFGRAGENARVENPGPHFKWPYPIQSVRKYDTRDRVLETRIENVQTADNQLITVQVFLVWQISDVLKYFQRMENESVAATHLTDRLRSNLGVFSQYDFGELLAQSGGLGKMSEAEERMLNLLVDPSDGSPGVDEYYGITPRAVGITRFILPENTTTAVFERMKQTRQTIAADARASGEAEASRIRTEATTAAEKIRRFAELRAASIRAIGEKEAARHIAQQAALDPEFAIYLRQLEAVETMVTANTTFIFPAKFPFELLIQPPNGGLGVLDLEKRASLAADENE